MSSHHIVRENQEPALLVEDFHALSAEYLGQILEWSPTIITNEENLDYFLAQGIKVDILYGDDTVNYQEDIKWIKPQKDLFNDALTYLKDHNYKAVNIFASSCTALFLDFADKLNIVVFAQGIRNVAVSTQYQKWKRSEDKMYVDVAVIKSFNGLQHLYDNVFEVQEDGFIVLEFNTENFVFVGEEV